MRDSRFADTIIATVLLAVSHQVAHAQDTRPPASTDTVHVASPTAERDADRASILGALERAGPGSVVQFGAGTYVIGEFITVSTPRVALQGHPEGTTLWGCDPGEFAANGCAATGGNRIEGHPDGISIAVLLPGTHCHHNVIRDNTIIVRRVRTARTALSTWRHSSKRSRAGCR